MVRIHRRTDSINDDPLDPYVAGLRAGDDVALAEIYDLTSGLLASIANGMLGNHTLAEDVVHDVYVKLAQSAGSFRGDDGRALRGWLVRATRNRVIDVRRSAAVQRERPTVDVPSIGHLPAADEQLDADLAPELAEGLRSLTEDQRMALVLTHVGGFSGEEVARALDRSRAAVYTLLRRAERAMRTHLA